MSRLGEVLFWLLLIGGMTALLSLREPETSLCSGPVDELYTPCVKPEPPKPSL
jgi:hypothetical protein